MEATHLVMPNGDRLDYFASRSDGDVLLFHHGTPAAGPIPRGLAQAAHDHGFRVIELVRPGYGQSTRVPGRTVVDVVPLVEQLVDHLQADRFVTMGWSGGGPHALATVTLMPDRCMAAMSLAGVAPYDADGLDFLAGMGEDNIAEFGAAVAGVPELEAFLNAALPSLQDVTADQVIASIQGLLPSVDQAYLTGEAAEEAAAEFRWSVAHGIYGWLDDDIAFTLPWGFDLGTIRRPVQIWQGTDDLMVPFAHGRWLVREVPGALPELRTGEGHLSLAAHAFSTGFGALRAAMVTSV